MQKSTFDISLVGSGGILGKEVKAFLEERAFPVSKIKLLDSEKYEGVVSEFNGEALLITPVDEDSFTHSDIIFFCCSHECGVKYFSFPRKKQSLIIDFSMVGQEKDNAPIINYDVNRKDIGRQSGVISAPHPVSIALTNILHPLDEAFRVKSASVHVFQPASDFGEEGIDELARQTISILNCSKIPKKVFGRQLAFNMIPSFMLPHKAGERSADSYLGEEISGILNWSTRKLAIRMFLAPVFYCHSFSIHITFKSTPLASDALRRLKTVNLAKLAPKSVQRGTPVETAGTKEMFIFELAEDGLLPGGFWIWLVSDNLFSYAALNAVKIAEAFIAGKHSH